MDNNFWSYLKIVTKLLKSFISVYYLGDAMDWECQNQ